MRRLPERTAALLGSVLIAMQVVPPATEPDSVATSGAHMTEVIDPAWAPFWIGHARTFIPAVLTCRGMAELCPFPGSCPEMSAGVARNWISPNGRGGPTT